MKENDTPKRLCDCDTDAERVEWVRRALQQGRTLTDPGLFVAGADGMRIVRKLRREGVPVKTVYVKTVDAAGTVHPRTLAWKLDEKSVSGN